MSNWNPYAEEYLYLLVWSAYLLNTSQCGGIDCTLASYIQELDYSLWSRTIVELQQMLLMLKQEPNYHLTKAEIHSKYHADRMQLAKQLDFGTTTCAAENNAWVNLLL